MSLLSRCVIISALFFKEMKFYLNELFGFVSRLCCQCGVPIEPNPANMCVGCLRTQVDITEGIPKQVTLHFCRSCERLGAAFLFPLYFAEFCWHILAFVKCWYLSFSCFAGFYCCHPPLLHWRSHYLTGTMYLLQNGFIVLWNLRNSCHFVSANWKGWTGLNLLMLALFGLNLTQSGLR